MFGFLSALVKAVKKIGSGLKKAGKFIGKVIKNVALFIPRLLFGKDGGGGGSPAPQNQEENAEAETPGISSDDMEETLETPVPDAAPKISFAPAIAPLQEAGTTAQDKQPLSAETAELTRQSVTSPVNGVNAASAAKKLSEDTAGSRNFLAAQQTQNTNGAPVRSAPAARAATGTKPG